MCFWYYFFGIIAIIAIIIIILGYPRKRNSRVPNFEGLDDPEVAKAFERITNFAPFRLLRRKIISRVKKVISQGILVDLGCGSGNLIVEIAQKIPTLHPIGVDISSEILEYAKKRAATKKLDQKIEFRVGEAQNLPFEDNSIDFVVSSFSLHHWSDPLGAFQEIFRVLKENGTFLIFDFRRDSRKFFYGFFTFVTKVVVPKALKKVNEPLGSIQSSYAPQEVLQFFSQISFQAVKIDPYLAWMFISGKK